MEEVHQIIRENLEINQTVSDEEFLRHMFYNLSIDDSTPSDIMEARFSKPICREGRYFIANGTVDISYSVSIGYDYEHKYTEYDKTAGKFVERSETLTNWTPYQGSYSNGYTAPMVNDKNISDSGEMRHGFDYYTKREQCIFLESLSTLSEDASIETDVKELGEEEIYPNAVKCVQVDLAYLCMEDIKKSLPGDRYKNFTILNCSAIITKIRYFKAPIYDLEYKYKNETYKNSCFAFGKFHRIGRCPEAYEENEKAVEKKVKPLDKLSLFINIFTLIVSVLAFINIETGLTLPMFIVYLSPIMLFVCLISFIVLSKRRKKRIVLFEQSKWEQKKKAYIKCMSKYGLGTPSSQTLSDFNKSVRTNAIVKTGLRTFTIVMFVLAMIASFLIMVSGGGLYYLFELLGKLNVLKIDY